MMLIIVQLLEVLLEYSRNIIFQRYIIVKDKWINYTEAIHYEYKFKNIAYTFKSMQGFFL